MKGLLTSRWSNELKVKTLITLMNKKKNSSMEKKLSCRKMLVGKIDYDIISEFLFQFSFNQSFHEMDHFRKARFTHEWS